MGGHFGTQPIKRGVCGGKPLGRLVVLSPLTGLVDFPANWVPHLDQKKDPSYDGGWQLTTAGNRLWVGGGFIGVSDSVNPRPAAGVTEVPQTNLARFTYDLTLP